MIVVYLVITSTAGSLVVRAAVRSGLISRSTLPMLCASVWTCAGYPFPTVALSALTLVIHGPVRP